MASARRISNECKTLVKDSSSVRSAEFVDGNSLKLNLIILSPETSKFQGKEFSFDLEFLDTYPFVPPKAKFHVPIDLPTYDEKTGYLCMQILLQENWLPSKRISHIVNDLIYMMEHESTPLH